MKVSIIIPVYNVEDYIYDCLVSVEKQLYENIECIIVDDCGCDKSMEIAHNFVTNYQGNVVFKIFRRQSNGGLSEARNSGINYASGDYLFFLDSDDEITEDAISYLVDKIREKNYDMACADFVHNRFEIDNNTALIEEDFSDNRVCLAINKKNNGWNKLVRRSLLIENKLYFESGLFHEDRLWNFLVNFKLQSVFWSNKITYIYRVRPNSIITDISKSEKRVNDSLIIVKIMEKYFNETHFTSMKERNIIFNYIERERYGVCISAFKYSHQKAFLVFNSLKTKYNFILFLSLPLHLKFKYVCWLFPSRMGFMYVNIFFNLYYNKSNRLNFYA